MKYLAYFQAFSNTYAPIDVLKQRYEEALACEDVVGLVIGTRPDCVDEGTLDYLASLSRQTFLLVEYGVESFSDSTLLEINRGHDAACSIRAIEATHRRGILTGAHLILGLPGEDNKSFLHQAEEISRLPIDVLKLHQLQVIKGTAMAQDYVRQPFHLYSLEEYIALIAAYLEHLRSSIVVDRFVSQSPPEMVLAPHWGIKNHEFTDKLRQYMAKRGMYQGRLCGI